MKRLNLVILLLAALLTTVPANAWAGINIWSGGGPDGAAIRAVLVSPPNTVYVGTIGGGVFKTTNGGTTWTQTEPAGALATLSVRALVFGSAGTIYAGVDGEVDGESGVYQSIDAGASWTPIGTAALGMSNRKVQALVWDGTNLYAGTREQDGVTGGVFKLDTVAGTWTQKNTGLPNQSSRRVQALAIDSRLSPPVVYAGTQGEGVFKSVDGGDTWTRIDIPSNQGFHSDCLEKPEILALAVDETIALIGATGAVLYAGATGEIGTSNCTPTPAQGGNQGMGPGFFRYVPEGFDITGCPVQNPTRIGCWDRRMQGDLKDLLQETLSVHVWSIVMKTNTIPTRIFIATDIGVFMSDDSASNWDALPHYDLPDGLFGFPIRALGMDATAACTQDGDAGTVKLWAGVAGRGMFSRCPNVPRGEHPWTSINSGLAALRAQSVAVANLLNATSKIYAGLSSGGVVTSVNGGATWQTTEESERTILSLAPDPGVVDTVYAGAGNGVLKTADGGTTWTPVNNGLPLVCNFPIPAQQTQQTECLRDQDPNGPNPPRQVRSVFVDPARLGVVYAAISGVHRSVDGGATWAPLNGTAPNNLPDVVTCGESCPGNGIVTSFVVDHASGDPEWGAIYVGTDASSLDPPVDGQGIYRSLDGGASWSLTSGDIPPADAYIRALVRDPMPAGGALVTLYAGTATGKVFTTANGSNWAEVSNGLPGNAVTALAIDLGNSKTIYAALDGAGVYRSINGGFTWTPFNTGLPAAAQTVPGLALDGTQNPHALYAATSGRGLHDYKIDFVGEPILLPTFPPSPFQQTEHTIDVTGTFIDDTGLTKMLWTTNRGHAGLAEFGTAETGPTGWIARDVPLEFGLNLITITAVDTNLNESSKSLTVTVPVLTPEITVSPTSLAYGNVPVGTASPMQSVTVRNDGTANLVIGTVTLGGANPDQFKMAPANDLCSGQTLAPAATCTVGIRFKPTSNGAKTATLGIPSNDADEPTVNVPLTGTGGAPAAPEITVTPTSLAYGNVPVGTASPMQSVTVRNDGTGNLVIGTVALGGANPDQFKMAPANDLCSGQTLAPAATCTVGIRFKPTSGGAKSATLAVPSNDADEPTVNVALSGTGGAPEITVTPTTFQYGTVPVGTASTMQSVTVRNDGTANLVIGTVALGGANPDQFKMAPVNDLCSGQTLAPAATCTVGMRFKPTSSGVKSATVTFPSNDADEPSVPVTLGGTGQ